MGPSSWFDVGWGSRCLADCGICFVTASSTFGLYTLFLREFCTVTCGGFMFQNGFIGLVVLCLAVAALCQLDVAFKMCTPFPHNIYGSLSLMLC